MPAEAGPGQPREQERAPLWERIERPAQAPRTTLTSGRIAAAAVAIADAESLDAVTMRRLAAELGVAPMAAYRYVSGKRELLELMTDFVYAEVELPDGTDGWRETMRTLATRLRDVLLRHSWVTRSTWCEPTPHQLAVPERVLASLDGQGLDSDAMMAVYRTVAAYVQGSVDAEVIAVRAAREHACSDGGRPAPAPGSGLAWLIGTGRYPHYTHYLGTAARKDDCRWHFETGLDCVLDGIAARLGL